MTNKDRREWMGLLARSAPDSLAALIGPLPQHSFARAPEIGAVMVRGRAGGTGAPFNLGEMSVTRCTIQLADGTVGHAWVQGRDKAHATRAAIVDALMQGATADEVRGRVLVPLAEVAARRAATRRAKAAATKVEFFTMVRGED
ncbi:phosphonate C-P lyase system protein PhnG [Paracoccus caeni]|uniref:Phosphonate C-P lyase system protein PhnG n=1 Tax=Paracoccus caeni TaxID=657651 RepID=A0A934SFW5_9RHOB|nr:phosphonate C-P lyase system protein PhnG [Paracoccus caeni]MBK4216908.1 phosphonate C-P lyase system protein PhnG [Paracoccus caeni]